MVDDGCGTQVRIRVPGNEGKLLDAVGRLIQAFSARGAMSSAASKLDALMDLERLRDPRVVPFLLLVLGDDCQPTEVRIHVLKWLRDGRMTPRDRSSVAHAVARLLAERSNPELRLQAALSLGEFTDIPGVVTGLGTLAVSPDEPIDLRYSAFTSIDRAGPTSECVTLLRQLSTDETLGRSAQNALLRWRLT